METKTQVKREIKPQDKQQRKTPLLFLDLCRLTYLQAWGADKTASLPCHPQGKQFWVGPGPEYSCTWQDRAKASWEQWIAKMWSHFGRSCEGWRNQSTRLSAHLSPWGQELFPPDLTGMDLLLSLASAKGLAGSGTRSYVPFTPFLAFCS